MYNEIEQDIDTYLENKDYGLGAAIDASIYRRKAQDLIDQYKPSNLIFKDGKALGRMVDTSEGYCAEKLDSDKWLWPKEFYGWEGFYDLWEELEANGYQVWVPPAHVINLQEDLALSLQKYEQDRQS